MKNNITPKSRKENLVVQELEGEVLVYDLAGNKALCLNQTSALIWQACDGSRTIAEIGDTVGKQLNSQINEDMVWLALDQLSKENLVEKQAEVAVKFNGLSRRQVIRNIGLASVVALPLITSLVAPRAINAASACVAPVGTCVCTAATSGGQSGNPCVATTNACSAGCACVYNANANGTTAGRCA